MTTTTTEAELPTEAEYDATIEKLDDAYGGDASQLMEMLEDVRNDMILHDAKPSGSHRPCLEDCMGCLTERIADVIVRTVNGKTTKDHDELRDKRTDLLNIRGILSPQGRSPGLGPVVPMPLGKDVAPAVEWLVNEVDELREENLRLRGVKAEPDVWSRPLTDNERAFQDGA
jgi:hypothetical protein